jgi:hypothetical protein
VNNKKIGITYGAEKEKLPEVGDTIKEYYSLKKVEKLSLEIQKN